MNALVGYDSDSDASDRGTSPQPQPSGGGGGGVVVSAHDATKAPPPAPTLMAARRPGAGGLGALLPPPKNAKAIAPLPPSALASELRATSTRPPQQHCDHAAPQKRRQIKVESLSSLKRPSSSSPERDSAHEAAAATAVASTGKRTKQEPAVPAGTTTKLSLFGMLPAPSEKLTEARRAEVAKRTTAGQASTGAGLDDGNDDGVEVRRPSMTSKPSGQLSSPLLDSGDGGDGRVKATAVTPGGKRGKGNADFRAMLGLKPSTQPPPPPPPPGLLAATGPAAPVSALDGPQAKDGQQRRAPAVPIVSEQVGPLAKPAASRGKGVAPPPPTRTARPSGQVGREVTRGGGGAATGKDAEEDDAEEADASGGMDFFSLAQSGKPKTAAAAAGAATRVEASQTTTTRPSAAPAISSAPLVEEDESGDRGDQGAPKAAWDGRKNGASSSSSESYPGWQQDPDGSWVPVTPEAHEQYAQWLLEEQRRARRARNEAASAVGSRRAAEELEMLGVGGGGDAEAAGMQSGAGGAAIQEYSATELASRGREHLPPPSSIDRRYASAAREIAALEAAGGEDDGEGEGASAAAARGKESKMTGARARQRGQLSALLVQAEEKRETLEERWAKGRVSGAEKRARYGF